MKVLVITDLCRGSAVTLPERELYKSLNAKGIGLTVITHWKTPETEDLEKQGIVVYYIPVMKKIDLKAARRIREIIKQEKSDILYLTFGKALTNGLLAARGIKIKIVGYIGSLNVHWHDPTAYLSFLNPRIDRMVCLSDAVLEHFIKQGGRKLKEKSVRIYKGYDPGWIKVSTPVTRASLGIPEGAFVVGCVANVRRIKGIPYLIRSADYLPSGLPVYFILTGNGMDSGRLLKMAAKTKYKNNFRQTGFTGDIFARTALCDLYVQPSVTEGLGRSLIEAMCLRKPVIVTERGGAKELVDEGVNGFVVPVKSPREIAGKILWCFNNAAKLPEMGERSLTKVKTMLNPQRAVEETYKLFCEVMAE